jgi:glutamate/tyrosine decarboxylase-like PLP-dependent enzyme
MESRPHDRESPLELAPEEFRRLGHALVDEIAGFLASLPKRPVTRAASPEELRALLPQGGLPEQGEPPDRLLAEAAQLLFDRSLLNGHPRFWGYITSSAAPIGALADLLAASVNPNVGGWALSPVATEIEAQTVAWIADLLGYPTSCGGLLVSGGNMANVVCLLAARKARLPGDVRAGGIAAAGGRPVRIYASTETHTWLQTAADLVGLGTDSIAWIPTDGDLRLDLDALRDRLREDEEAGALPLAVVGAAGTVSTGAVDPLAELAELARERGIWLHVDAAYGGFAVALPDASPDLRALREADSVAVDPHKWLYAPLEAGCALVRDRALLRDTFSFRPPYYRFGTEDEEGLLNYFEYGPQNSRGFRALKVWLGLRQAGRSGYARMIADDVGLAGGLFDLARADPELEAWTTSLSITTFRFRPADLAGRGAAADAYLDKLNTALLDRLQAGGEAFVSNAVVDGRFLLRACIVNFRTTRADLEALVAVVKRLGRELDAALRPRGLAGASLTEERDESPGAHGSD